jgi:hypothetical protein
MVTYCYKLRLPPILDIGLPLINDHGIVPVDYSKTFYYRIETPTLFNQQLFDWLDSLNLCYIASGYIYVPENGSVPPHVDSRLFFNQQKFVDFCKINWRIGGSGSMAKLYDSLPGFKLIPQDSLPESVTSDGYQTHTNVCLPEVDTFEEAYSVEHPETCLLNPGRIHSFDAGPYAQHIVSVAIGIKNTSSVLPWHQGIKIFKKYIAH